MRLSYFNFLGGRGRGFRKVGSFGFTKKGRSEKKIICHDDAVKIADKKGRLMLQIGDNQANFRIKTVQM